MVTNNTLTFVTFLIILLSSFLLPKDVLTTVAMPILLFPFVIIVSVVAEEAAHLYRVAQYLVSSPVATENDECSNDIIATEATPTAETVAEEVGEESKRAARSFHEYATARQRNSTRYQAHKDMRRDWALECPHVYDPDAIDKMLARYYQLQCHEAIPSITVPLPSAPNHTPSLDSTPTSVPSSPTQAESSMEDELEEETKDASASSGNPGGILISSDDVASGVALDACATSSNQSEDISCDEEDPLEHVADLESASITPNLTFIADPIAHGLRFCLSWPANNRSDIDDETLDNLTVAFGRLELGEDDALDDILSFLGQSGIIPSSLPTEPTTTDLPATPISQEGSSTLVSPSLVNASLDKSTSAASAIDSVVAALDMATNPAHNDVSAEELSRNEDEEKIALIVNEVTSNPTLLSREEHALITPNNDLDTPMEDCAQSGDLLHATSIDSVFQASSPDSDIQANSSAVEDEVYLNHASTEAAVPADMEQDAEVAAIPDTEQIMMEVQVDAPNTNANLPPAEVDILMEDSAETTAFTSLPSLASTLQPVATAQVLLATVPQLFQIQSFAEGSSTQVEQDETMIDISNTDEGVPDIALEDSVMEAVEQLPASDSCEDAEMAQATTEPEPLDSEMTVEATPSEVPLSLDMILPSFPLSSTTSSEAAVASFDQANSEDSEMVVDVSHPTMVAISDCDSNIVPTASGLSPDRQEFEESTFGGLTTAEKDSEEHADKPAADSAHVDENHLQGTPEEEASSHSCEINDARNEVPVDEQLPKSNEMTPIEGSADDTLTPDNASPKIEESPTVPPEVALPEIVAPAVESTPSTAVVEDETCVHPDKENTRAPSVADVAPTVAVVTTPKVTTPTTANPVRKPAPNPMASYLRSSTRSGKSSASPFTPAARSRGKDAHMAPTNSTVAPMTMNRAGKDVKSMLAAAAIEMGCSRPVPKNKMEAGSSSLVPSSLSATLSARGGVRMQKTSYVMDEDEDEDEDRDCYANSSEDEMPLFGMSSSEMIKINKVEVTKSALERFKRKVLSKRGAYKYASDEFVNEVVQKGMQECGVEGLIWQMATNDPLACDSTTRRDHRWYLRWAVNKFHLAPESKKPTEGVSEMAVGEDGGRRVVGLRKGRLASAVFEESAMGVHRPCHQPPRDD